MSDETAGVGAEVGVKKLDSDGNVMERRGTSSNSRIAYTIFYLLIILSGFGVWKVLELLSLIW